MVKSKFALFVDSVILSIILTILSFVWFRKIFKSANYINFFLIIILILCFILIYNFLLKINKKKIFKNNNEKFLNSCLNHLLICPFEEYKNFICKLLNCCHINEFIFKINNHFLYINLKTETTPNDYFSAQEIFLKESNIESKLYFICKSKSKSFDEIIELSKLKLYILEYDIISKLMAQKNIFPIEKDKVKKQPFKQTLIKYFKNKTQGLTNKHFKELFFSGISLLFLSLIVPFSNLYLILGSFLLIISIITLFRKNYKKENHESDFLFK